VSAVTSLFSCSDIFLKRDITTHDPTAFARSSELK